jgi:beta-1,4-mannosyl-glycoprotein beta-1,4-N-acetylglucosaminyltransferase
MIHRERAVLDWRLRELTHVVDDFVVVEATKTFSGRPRSLLRPDRDRLFAHVKGRLHVTIIDDLGDGPDAWPREYLQREAIWTRGAAFLDPADDDLVVISDADEVPFPEVVEALATSNFDPPVFVRPLWFNYDWNGFLGPWDHASIFFYTAGFLRNLVKSGRGPEIGRRAVAGRELRGLNGWHASWFGSDEDVLDKLASYSHAPELGNRQVAAEGPEGIQRRRRSGHDLFGIRATLNERPRLPVHADRALGLSIIDFRRRLR